MTGSLMLVFPEEELTLLLHETAAMNIAKDIDKANNFFI